MWHLAHLQHGQRCDARSWKSPYGWMNAFVDRGWHNTSPVPSSLNTLDPSFAATMSDEYALPPALTRLFDMSAPYSRAATEAITARRAAMPEQRLFFDRLLAFAEVDGEGCKLLTLCLERAEPATRSLLPMNRY